MLVEALLESLLEHSGDKMVCMQCIVQISDPFRGLTVTRVYNTVEPAQRNAVQTASYKAHYCQSQGFVGAFWCSIHIFGIQMTTAWLEK